MGTGQQSAFGPYEPRAYVAAGGNVVTDPQAVMTDGGLVAVYATGGDGHVRGTTQTGPGGGWTDRTVI